MRIFFILFSLFVWSRIKTKYFFLDFNDSEVFFLACGIVIATWQDMKDMWN